MTLKVGDRIRYNAGKGLATILDIKGNGRHTLYVLSDGDSQIDLEKKVGKPGGVEVLPVPVPEPEIVEYKFTDPESVLPKTNVEIPMPPAELAKEVTDSASVIDVISAGLEANEPLTDEEVDAAAEAVAAVLDTDQEDLGPELLDPPEGEIAEQLQEELGVAPEELMDTIVEIDNTLENFADGEAVEEHAEEPVAGLIDPNGPQLRHVNEGKFVEKPEDEESTDESEA